jgi:preprotein translocase subunit SecE
VKLNWQTFKVAFAMVIIGVILFWAVDSIRSRSYSGTSLSFDTAGGVITVTNPSADPATAQLTGSGSRSFRVASTIEGVTGSSTRVGTGSTQTHLFAFELPPGTSEFIVSGGTNVRFVADTATELQATVNPMSSESRRNTLIAAAVVVFGALFYASHVIGHQWIKNLRDRVLPSRPDTSKQDTEPTPVVMDGGQGRAARSYGDNRADINH